MNFCQRITLLVLSLISFSDGQTDPIKSFCRLFGHSTAIVDREMYIDGGFVNWDPISADSINYTNTWFKSGHLDDIKDGFPAQYGLDKNDSVPSVVGGVLWADEANKIIYQYGGDYGNEKPEPFKLWLYDVAYKTWNISVAATMSIQRASWGAGAVAQDEGKGYYYGGWLTNLSVPTYNSRTALKNMLVYNMLDHSFKNQSGPDGVARAEGAMVYLPAGDKGLMVYFGGVQLPFNNSTLQASPMTDIYIYDIAGEHWYNQSASGDTIPGDRRRFCAGASWPEDQSSYNIYLFGGASVGDGVGFGDVWILSLPSFKWIKFWPQPGDGDGKTFPHHSLSCDVIGNSQMIIMGGHFTNSTDCDVPKIQGQHGLDLGKAGPENKPWAAFNPKLTTYKVPNEIYQTIGGTASGGSTLNSPAGGWTQRDLQTLFSRKYIPKPRQATRYLPMSASAPAPNDNEKAVIGGAVGGAVGGLLLFVTLGICICLRRRKKKSQNSNGQSHVQPPQPELRSQPISPAAHSEGKIPMTSQNDVDRRYSNPSHYAVTPRDMSPPPSEGSWSPYASTVPTYSGPFGQPVYPASVPHGYQHSRSPSEPSHYNPASQWSPSLRDESPTAAVQELPVIRSPLGVNAVSSMQPMNAPGSSDSWFAQNPPRT